MATVTVVVVLYDSMSTFTVIVVRLHVNIYCCRCTAVCQQLLLLLSCTEAYQKLLLLLYGCVSTVTGVVVLYGIMSTVTVVVVLCGSISTITVVVVLCGSISTVTVLVVWQHVNSYCCRCTAACQHLCCCCVVRQYVNSYCSLCTVACQQLLLLLYGRIRNSSPGGLRPSTLLLGHGGSPQ